MSDKRTLLLRVAAVLWVIWGAVHAFAGGIVLSLDGSDAVAAIADAVDPALLVAEYHAAADGVINQHGWNLLWFGIATIIGAIMIWRGSETWIWVTAMVGGLADLGYLLFLDLPGFVNFMPGTVMTIISASAIILSFFAWRFLPASKSA